ncbi:MAG TPA: glycosyltransferase family 9 protein, partial [Phycisphaerales bacterium]|nr:glycosyltransferase family 9 protein [Phycisphaerales bacterium]
MPDAAPPSSSESVSRAQPPRRPLRLLVVMPSWLGDVVMATPALRLLRDGLPGSFIGGLVRPGLDELIAGTDLLDEVHVDRARGVMGPKLVAAKIRPRRYDAALLLANSFSTALVTRLAFIPRRIGYDRDGRGMLLTDRIKPEREHEGVMGKMGVGAFVPVSAVEYYLRA